MKKLFIFIILLTIAMPVCAAGVAASRRGGMSIAEWHEYTHQGYIRKIWTKTHNKLSSNMSVQNIVKYETPKDLVYELEIKTNNINNIIEDVNGQKIQYEIDKYQIICRASGWGKPEKGELDLNNEAFSLLETNLYNKNNEIVKTLNKHPLRTQGSYYAKDNEAQMIRSIVEAKHLCK